MPQTIKQKAEAIALQINNSPADVQRDNINFTHKDEAEQEQIVNMVVKLAKKNFVISHPVMRRDGNMVSSILWGASTQNVDEWDVDGVPYNKVEGA